MSTSVRRAAFVVTVALAGLALAVALALLTSHLTSQHVGLAGEPPRPATGLVVPANKTRPAPTTTTTPSAPVQSDEANEAGEDD